MKKCIFFSSSPNADTFFIFGAGMPVVDAAQRENMPGTYFFRKNVSGRYFLGGFLPQPRGAKNTPKTYFLLENMISLHFLGGFLPQPRGAKNIPKTYSF